MAVREVVLFGDPGLTEPAVTVDMGWDKWKKDADDLQDTLTHLRRTHGFGRGLAAQQIGSRFRMIAFECDLGRFIALNPRITWASDTRQAVWDDCFSLPGASVAVTRSASVTFEYTGCDGETKTLEHLSPADSELVQHELDHLDGILMTVRMVEPGAIIASQMADRTPHPSDRELASREQ